MTKTKHTPGPWYISEVENGYAFISANEHERLARVVWQIEDDEVCGECSPSCEANAHLIAAAPELLEALKHCEVVLTIVNGVDKDLLTKEALERVSTAINKAEGGE